jgi:hypothetical protein
MRGAGVWAAGAAGRMPAVARNLPGYVERLHIFAERDGGLLSAKEAARIAAARGIEVHMKERPVRLGAPDGPYVRRRRSLLPRRDIFASARVRGTVGSSSSSHLGRRLREVP